MTQFQSYRIKNIEVRNGLVLAPMSGVTTSAFRRLVRELNGPAVGLMISEFISVEALTRQIDRALKMMEFREQERPIGVQIFGHDVDRMVTAAKMVEDSGADLLDLNCGCPAPKVVRKGGGCELMRQPEHLSKIISAIRKAVKIPFTMKFRSGWDDSSKNAIEIAKMAEGEGVDALAIHGRTRAQLYRGEADWDLVSAVARAVSIPVAGSGDVVDRSSAFARLKLGVSGLFIGRGALCNPLIFKCLVDDLENPLNGQLGNQCQVAFRYLGLLREDFSDEGCIGKMKQLISQMFRGSLDSAQWRRNLCLSKKLPEMIDQLKIASEQGDINLGKFVDVAA